MDLLVESPKELEWSFPTIPVVPIFLRPRLRLARADVVFTCALAIELVNRGF